MKIVSFKARRWLLGAAVLLSVFLAACGPAPLGVDWAALSTVGAEQNILIAFNHQMLMIDPTTGKPLELRDIDGDPILDQEGNPRIWEVKGADIGNQQFYSSPVVIDANTLLVAGYDNRIFEVDIPRARVENPSGEPIRTEGNTHVVADMVANGDLLYVGLAGHDLVALNKADLTEQWAVSTEHGVWSAPLIVDDVAYFTSLDHFLYAVDATTGEEFWRLDLGGTAVTAPVYAPPTDGDDSGHLYIGSFARAIFDISPTGEILNRYATHGWVWGTPTLVDGFLYAGDLEGWVYALDTQDGLAEVWARQLEPSAIAPSPLVSGDTLIVATRVGKLHWLNRNTGASLTETDEEGGFKDLVRSLNGEIFSDLLLLEPSESLQIDSPMVVVSTMAPDQILVAFDVNDGQRLWGYPQQ